MRVSLILVTAALSSIALASPVSAQITGVLTGASDIYVWKDARAQDDGFALIKAGTHKTNPNAVIRLMACMVPDGTRAALRNPGLSAHEVLILDGKAAGCAGTVPPGLFKRR